MIKLNTEAELIKYFKDQYSKLWFEYFYKIKSKKEIWNILVKTGFETRSLSAFYSYNRDVNLDEYLNSFIKTPNILEIMELLDINDKIIEDSMPELLKTYEENRARWLNEAYAIYRKRI